MYITCISFFTETPEVMCYRAWPPIWEVISTEEGERFIHSLDTDKETQERFQLFQQVKLNACTPYQKYP